SCELREPHSFPTRRSSDLRTTNTTSNTDNATTNTSPGTSSTSNMNITSTTKQPPPNININSSLNTNITPGSNVPPTRIHHPAHRSEEHTSELQSRENLVCR